MIRWLSAKTAILQKIERRCFSAGSNALSVCFPIQCNPNKQHDHSNHNKVSRTKKTVAVSNHLEFNNFVFVLYLLQRKLKKCQSKSGMPTK